MGTHHHTFSPFLGEPAGKKQEKQQYPGDTSPREWHDDQGLLLHTLSSCCFTAFPTWAESFASHCFVVWSFVATRLLTNPCYRGRVFISGCIIYSFPKPSHPSAGKSPLASRYSCCCATYCSCCSSSSVAWKNTAAGFRVAHKSPQSSTGLSVSIPHLSPSSICNEVWKFGKLQDSHLWVEMTA